jgi:hypothetical protein
MPGTCLLEMRKFASYKLGINAGIQDGYLQNKEAPRLDQQLCSRPSGATSNCVFWGFAYRGQDSSHSNCVYIHTNMCIGINTREHIGITKSTTRLQHDHLIAPVIAQHYSSPPFVSIHFYCALRRIKKYYHNLCHPSCVCRRRNNKDAIRPYTTFIIEKLIAATCFGYVKQSSSCRRYKQNYIAVAILITINLFLTMISYNTVV